MSWVWRARHPGPERMDVESLVGDTAARIARELSWINRWLGGQSATIRHFRQFSRGWKKGQTIRVLDVGTGGADVPRALVLWARCNGFSLHVTGIDTNAAMLEAATEACRGFPEIELLQTDARQMPVPTERFDYVISSLTLHHLTSDEIVNLLRWSDNVATRGIVMNDLIRNVRAAGWIWILTRLFPFSSIVRHDSVLSVRRGFASAELDQLAATAGLTYLHVRTHFGYRYTLAGEKR